MYPYQIVDAHCDTVGQIYQPTSLGGSVGHLDLPRMKQYKNWLQFFAVWADAADGVAAQEQKAKQIIRRFYNEIEENKEQIAPVLDYAGVLSKWAQDKVAALLAIEGADFIDSLEKLHQYYEMGVRAITLTWNNTNCIATGSGERRPRIGLTEYGRAVVQEMNRLGILIDVSHASEKTFWDVAETSRMPIIASHSNSSAICTHPRNLTGEQFKALCRMGGVVGMNYCPLFIKNKGMVTIDDLIRHIEHFMSLGGEDHVGLGGDFDGISDTPAGLCGVQDVHTLLERLLALNYTEGQVNKIAGGNMLRLLGEVLR